MNDVKMISKADGCNCLTLTVESTIVSKSLLSEIKPFNTDPNGTTW